MTTTLQTTASVHVEAETLSMGNNITGVISLRIGDHYFPDREWNDFPVVILSWWLTNLLHLCSGKTVSAEGVDCLFMDGDYYFSVTPHDGRWLIGFADEVPGAEAMRSIEVERAAFMREVLNCAAHVLDACRARGWHTKDTEYLATMVAHAEAVLVAQAA